MDPRQLLYFLSTARSEHMGKAAAELRISESTLSRSIARLEREHGVAFFDRVGRGVRLNAFGRVLLASVEGAFAALESGQRELRAMAHSGSARVALGFIASLGPQVVPNFVHGFAANHPQLQFRLIQGSAQSLRSRLLDGEIDLTLGTKRFDDAAVDWRPLWEEGLVAVVPAGHPIAQQHEADFADIAGDRILSFGLSETTRAAFADVARTTGTAPNVVFSCDDIATLSGLVSAGFGTAVIPESLHTARAGICCVRLPTAPKRTIGIAFATSRPLSSAARNVRDAIVRESAEYKS
jgi:LysR family transcriptional activator of glutamate synthase operon